MSKVQYGISPLTWTNDDMPELGGEIPLETCLSEMSESGFTGTELGTKYPREPETPDSVTKKPQFSFSVWLVQRQLNDINSRRRNCRDARTYPATESGWL